MTEASQHLHAFLNCLSNTAVPFALSSLAAVLVAVSIATLQQDVSLRRLIPFVVVSHVAPLLIAPVLFANLLVSYVESDLRLISWSQSTQFSAFCGFFFHSFLAYLVLSQVFMWSNRVERVRHLTFNTRRLSIIRAIYLLELAPPLLFTFAMVFVFQESMVSVPRFTLRPTVLSLAQSIMQGSSSLLYSWFVAIYLIASGALFLMAAYHIPKLTARRILSYLARRSDSSVKVRDVNPQLSRVLSKIHIAISVALVLISMVVHAGAVIVVFIRLFKLCEKADLSQTGPAWATLATPAMLCGVIAFAILLISTIVLTSRGSPTEFKPVRSIALVPPALLGTMGLLFVIGPLSQLLIAYILLLTYSYLLLGFFISSAELEADRVLLHNTKTLKLRFSRASVVILLTAVGGVLRPALIAFYFLWIEDGVQVTILTSEGNLASLVRGLKQDKLVPATYYGVLTIFAAWLVVSSCVYILTKYRHRFLAHRLRKLLAVTTFILIGFLTVLPSTAAQTRGATSSATTNAPCAYKEIIIPAREERQISDERCGLINIDEVILDGSVGSLNIVAPKAAVMIGKLTLPQAGTVLNIIGTPGQAIRDLSIRSISLPAFSPSDVPIINFRQAQIGRLTVNGLNPETTSNIPRPLQPKANIVFEPTSTAGEIEIHELIARELTLRLAGKEQDSVHFEHVNANSVRITSSSQQSNGTNIEGALTLEGLSEQKPSFILDNLRVRNVRLDILGNDGGDINITNVDMHPQANVNFLLAISKGNVYIHVEDVTLEGRLQFRAPSSSAALFNLTMYGMTRVKRSPESSTVTANLNNLSRLILKQFDIDGLELCSSSINANVGEELELQNVLINDDVVVPQGLMAILASEGPNTYGNLRFLKMLQEHGRFCEQKEIIGIQALYARKRAELLSLHPMLGWVIDWVTGLGVVIYKPAITFIVALVMYLILRIILIFSDNCGAETPRTRRSLMSEAVFGGFFTSDTPEQHRSGVKKSLQGLRVLYGWFVFIQITLCSIYLSQTTLQ